MKFIKTVMLFAVIGLTTVSCKKEKTTDADATEITTEEEVVEIEVETIASVETPPIYPDCEGGTNEEITTCLQQKLIAHVALNFDNGLSQDLNLEEGDHKIGVQFTINKEGNVSNVKSNAPNKALENEAIRVIELLPKMTPATKNGENVNMTYTLPIEFSVEG